MVARQLFGRQPERAEVYLHGSFAATGKGHGTDRALIAGLLGMMPDDMRIPDSYEVADNPLREAVAAYFCTVIDSGQPVSALAWRAAY